MSTYLTRVIDYNQIIFFIIKLNFLNYKLNSFNDKFVEIIRDDENNMKKGKSLFIWIVSDSFKLSSCR